MQQESQGKRSSPRKRVAGIVTHLSIFSTYLSVINTMHPFCIELVQNIELRQTELKYSCTNIFYSCGAQMRDIHTDTLIRCLCVICAFHLSTSNRTSRGNATGVPRQKKFTSKASSWYYYSLVYFLNMPQCYQHSALFYMEQV